MKILISAESLDLSGVPTYTRTLYNELIRLGHEVRVYSPTGGELAPYMGAVNYPIQLGFFSPDVILAQGRDCAATLRREYPNVPMVFSAHGIIPFPEQPPEFHVEQYIAINEQTTRNLVERGIPRNKIRIVRDFIDTREFYPFTKLRDTRPRVLFISNYKKWKNYSNLGKACEYLGMELKAIGSPYGRSRNVAEDINNADIVVTWGRGILEAMACGRAAISYDKERGDGYIDIETYELSRERNFSGFECRYRMGINHLMDELGKYNPKSGEVNRALVVENHDVRTNVEGLLEALNDAISSQTNPNI